MYSTEVYALGVILNQSKDVIQVHIEEGDAFFRYK